MSDLLFNIDLIWWDELYSIAGWNDNLFTFADVACNLLFTLDHLEGAESTDEDIMSIGERIFENVEESVSATNSVGERQSGANCEFARNF